MWKKGLWFANTKKEVVGPPASMVQNNTLYHWKVTILLKYDEIWWQHHATGIFLHQQRQRSWLEFKGRWKGRPERKPFRGCTLVQTSLESHLSTGKQHSTISWLRPTHMFWTTMNGDIFWSLNGQSWYRQTQTWVGVEIKP